LGRQNNKMKFNLRRDSKILLRASLSAYFALGLLIPIYAVFVQSIGGNVLDAGIAYAIFTISTGLFILLFGTSKFFSNHIRTMIVIGYILLALGFLSYLFVKTPIGLFSVELIIGVAMGVLDPAWDAVFSAKLEEKQGSKQWALWAGSTNIVTGISAVVGGLIVSHFSFRALFLIMFAFGILSAIISFGVLKNDKK
jgi:MFS family permease